MNLLSTLVRRMPAVSIFAFLLLAISSAAQAVDNVQSRYVGAAAGDWAGPTKVIGPPDNACANMGAVAKANLASGFGFTLPGNATVTGVTAFAKAGENGPQTVSVRLATDATIDPPASIGNILPLSVLGTGGNCAATTSVQVGTTLASWGSPVLTPAIVNDPKFGLSLTKIEASSIKVDSICMNIAYTTPEGTAVQENCFTAPPPPRINTIRVVKDVVGVAPGGTWAFTGEAPIGAFSLPADGGVADFPGLPDETYTITETVKAGYIATVQCLNGLTPVASGSNSVEVPVSGTSTIVCTFTNTEILPPPPITRATFAVTKDFTDNNPTATATVSISCDTGLPLLQDKVINEAAGVTFVVESFASGAMDCDVTEAAVPGYTTVSYVAGGAGGTNSATNALKCTFGDVVDGAAKTCVITNKPTPVQVSVIKDWNTTSVKGGDQIDPYYCIDLSCGTSEIIGGFNTTANQIANWTKELYCGTSYGTLDKTYTAHVVPKWDGSTACSVNGEVVADNSVESDNGCKNGALKPVIGGGGTKNACTITNTVFFEGIPTLSQYGMAIMALLMLGVGFVGFRRLV